MDRILLIGAAGYIGKAVAERLAKKGYCVVGLARSDSSHRKIQGLGYQTISGDMFDPVSLTRAVESCDGVIHCGGYHGEVGEGSHDDLVKLAANDQLSSETIVRAIQGTSKRYLHTTGATVFAEMSMGAWSDHWHDEYSDHMPPDFLKPRYYGERYLLAKDQQHEAHTIIVRPGIVHGRGGSLGPLGYLHVVRRDCVSAYLGDGNARLGFVHVDDLADLYILAFENAAPRTAFNAATEFLTGKAIADIHRRRCGLVAPCVSWSWETMLERWQFMLSMLLAVNELMTCKESYKIGWQPHHAGYEQDMIYGSYAAAQAE